MSPCCPTKVRQFLKGYAASVFWVEQQAKQENGIKQIASRALLASGFMLKMQATCSSTISGEFQWTVWSYISEDRIHHTLVSDCTVHYLQYNGFTQHH
jgi:hypothetical protein